MGKLVQNLYASSLFDVSSESKLTNAANTGEELLALKEIFSENADYVKLLSSPAWSKEQKHQLLDESFDGKLSAYTLNFLKLLVDNGRFGSIGVIIDEYQRIYDANNGIMQVTAITATKMDSDLEEKLVKKLNTLTGKNVKLTTVLDKSIIGGVRLRYDNTEIDSTVKSKLDELRHIIKQTTI